MVKTRTRSEKRDTTSASEGVEEESGDRIHVDVPMPQPSSQLSSSKRKRRKDDSGLGEATPTKKRKSPPVRTSDEDEVLISKTRPVVEIFSKIQSPLPAIDEVKDSYHEGSIGSPAPVDETDELRSDDDIEADENAGVPDALPPVSEKYRMAMDHHHEVPSSNPDDNESELEDHHERGSKETSKKKQHKRFGSEEPGHELFSTAPEVVTISDDEEEDISSADEAPEAVTTENATQTAKMIQRIAANAFKEQQAASRKKRQDYEEAVRKHQEEKRRKEERIARKAANRAAKFESVDNDPVEEDAEPRVLTLNPRSSLPNLLPLEYFEDDPAPASSALVQSEVARPAPKKTTFHDLGEKAPKDKRVGNTTYRVAKAISKELTPKASYLARQTKEAWLKGQRTGGSGKPVGGGGERRVMNKGFLKR